MNITEVDDLINEVDNILNEFDDLKGYENLYKINRKGQIFSKYFNKIMAPQIGQDVYYHVLLSKPPIIVDGKVVHSRHKGRIHRLLALQYIPNPDNKPEVDHIDRNKENNSLSNLRWASRIENRHNRPDIVANLSEEQLEERMIRMREYKRLWAETDRRNKGAQIKTLMNKTKDPEYYNNKAKEYRAKESEEQRAERLRIRREKSKARTKQLDNAL